MQLEIQNCELRETVNFKAFGERILYLDVGQKGVASLSWHVEAGAIEVAFTGGVREIIPWANVKRARPVAMGEVFVPQTNPPAAVKRPRGRPRKHPVVSDA